ncbi:hypothetical protein JJE66_33465 [Bradyrhizobium diazoefficiens]|uniref:hypothetical protein n=1 Tax=Bradyrhizobium diazoefficiens TaxID=1355477 RepID=UPI0019093C20|nr:hypothetical protein [Bradyrhizobium diazoefficiens]MBK3666118.1 hypothetical protein [Bradyrhizobium diazoefficiens]
MKLIIGNTYLAPVMTNSRRAWNKPMPPVFCPPFAAPLGSVDSDIQIETKDGNVR